MSTGKRTEFLGHGKVRETTFFSNGAKTIRVKKRGVFFDDRATQREAPVTAGTGNRNEARRSSPRLFRGRVAQVEKDAE
jgi:hypothetical protein